MSAPSLLPAALFDHAARHPDEPWLFDREGWDWRWYSWGDMAGRVAREAGRLASLPSGTKVPIPDVPAVESVVLDLAVQAAGLEEAPADLLAAMQRIREAIPPPSTPCREIVVAGRSLFDPVDRALLAWAIVAGAAVVLEPHRQARAATAAWARPTLFHGTPQEIASLRRLAGSGRRWWRRAPGLPFGRLRVLFVTEGNLPEEEAAFWRDRGVKVTGIAAERRNRGI